MPREIDEKAEGEERVGLLLAGRYRLLRKLGRGGMASVFEADDAVAGRRVALKLLHPERVATSDAALSQFETEFHTLTQLAHPRVVAVSDYQKLPDSALYTMELLDGGDLLERAPMPYREVCTLLCDVCSALALLHSRRFVHRDVTPRNIRCAQSGEAKLIDFGAMVPFGTHKHAVGTPPFASPEAVTGQPLDGRADLFSLGATAYYALTGRLAFQARTFAALRNVWRTVPPTPSRIAPGIPAELDQLVMSLLTLAPSHRPRSATEVMERLTAIAGIELAPELQTTSAYLATPTLVGRDPELQQVRRSVVRAARGRGLEILVTGESGVGRSRMADACALEGKLAGATVLRADAQDANSGPWGGVRSLLDQLVTELGADAARVVAHHAPVLAHIWPGALAFLPPDQELAPPPAGLRGAVQQALLSLFAQANQRVFMVVTADDIHRVDEPTAAFIALLAGQARAQRTVVVVTVDRNVTSDELKILPRLQKAGVTLDLAPLTRPQTEQLLTSTFGDVANVRLLADRMHSVAKGNPRTLMNLAQLLLDRKLLKYQHGTWVLPQRLSQRDLPSSPTAAMEQQLDRLEAAQLQLAQAMALTRLPSLTLAGCQTLAADPDSASVLSALDGLIQTHVVYLDGDHYALSHPGWAALLTSNMDAATARILHARVATMFGSEFRAAEHWLKAGENGRAIDALLERAAFHSTVAMQEPERLPELVQLLPDGWRDTFSAGIAAAESAGRPLLQILELKVSYLGILSVTAGTDPELLLETIWQVNQYAGLERYHALAGSVPDDQRLQVALEQTGAAEAALPERERGYPAIEAIRALARLKTLAIGMMGSSMDPGFFDKLPSLEPLFPLSPTLAIIERNVHGTQHMLAGRTSLAHQLQVQLLEDLKPLKEFGADASVHRYMSLAITFSTGVIETLTGVETALDRAAAIEHDPLFAIAAWQLRKLAALRRGNVEGAERCSRHIERLQIQNNPTQMFEGTEVWLDLRAWMEIGDVVRIRETTTRTEAVIRRFERWAPVPEVARGRIHQLRGEHSEAFAAYAGAMAATGNVRSTLWLAVARGYITALAHVGRFDEGRAFAGDAIASTQDGADGTHIHEIYYALAVLERLAGNHATALEHVEHALDHPTGWGEDSVFCGACHELAAQVATEMRDQAGLTRALAHCASIFRDSRNPVLIARYERMVQDAQRCGMLPEVTVNRDEDAEICTMTTAGPVLGQTKSALQRAERVLSVIVEQGVGRTAFLYLLRDRTPVKVASCGDTAAPPHLDELVRHMIEEELEAPPANGIDTQDFVTSTIDALAWANPSGEHFAPALLGHSGPQGFAITGVIVHQTEGAGYIPSALLDQLSVALADAGDVIPLRSAA